MSFSRAALLQFFPKRTRLFGECNVLPTSFLLTLLISHIQAFSTSTIKTFAVALPDLDHHKPQSLDHIPFPFVLTDNTLTDITYSAIMFATLHSEPGREGLKTGLELFPKGGGSMAASAQNMIAKRTTYNPRHRQRHETWRSHSVDLSERDANGVESPTPRPSSCEPLLCPQGNSPSWDHETNVVSFNKIHAASYYASYTHNSHRRAIPMECFDAGMTAYTVPRWTTKTASAIVVGGHRKACTSEEYPCQKSAQRRR